MAAKPSKAPKPKKQPDLASVNDGMKTTKIGTWDAKTGTIIPTKKRGK